MSMFDPREVDALARELMQIAGRGVVGVDREVRQTAREGMMLAKANARATARKHGKHYPRSITMDRLAVAKFEYGPDPALPQGDMSFEYGSRNQPPHLDLARSADQIEHRLPFRAQAAAEDAFRGW